MDIFIVKNHNSLDVSECFTKVEVRLLTCSAICMNTFIFKQNNLDLHNVSDNRQRVNTIGKRIHQGAFTSNITNRTTIKISGSAHEDYDQNRVYI